MITKKNIFHYIVYVVFALIFICSIGLYSAEYSNIHGSTDILIPMVIRYAVAVIGIVIAIAGFRIGIKYLPDQVTSYKIPAISTLIEVAGLAVVMLISLFARLLAITNVIGHENESVFLSYVSGNGAEIPDNFISVFYAGICSVAYGINQSQYLIYAINVFLQIAIILLTYYSFKKAFRIRFALLSTLLLSFLPGMFKSVTNVSSDTLLCFITVLYIFLLINICDLNKKGKIKENYHILYFVLLGVYSGLMIFSDIFGLVSLFVGIPVILLSSSKNDWLKVQKSWFQTVIFTISSIVTALLSMYIIPINNVRGIDGIVNYVNNFIPDGLSVSILVPMASRPETIVLYILVGVSILAFIRNDNDYGLIYVIISDIAAVFTFVNFNSSDYTALVNYSFCAMSVIGFWLVPSFVLSKEEIRMNEEKKRDREFEKEKKKAKRGKTNEKMSLSLEPVEGESVETLSASKEAAQVVSAPPKIPENLIEDNKPKEQVEIIKNETKPLIPTEEVLPEPIVKSAIIPSRREYKTAHVYKNEEEKALHESRMSKPVETSVTTDASLKEKPAMIKNVLPTPKPHVTKELTFDYIPEGTEMDFDINDLKGKDFYDI